MERVSISELTTLRWPFEEDVAWFHRLGFGGIGVWREKLTDFGEERGIELIREYGLQVSSLNWAGGFTGSDGRSHKESIEDAIEAIETACELEAGCLVVHPGSSARHTRRHARRLLQTALEELMPIAADYGVTLALEPMSSPVGRDWTFLTSLDEASQLIDEIGSPNLKLVADLFHLGRTSDLYDQLERHLDEVCLVQIADQRHEAIDEPNCCLLGHGTLSTLDVIHWLEQKNFGGHYEVEMLGEELELMSYPHILTHTREVLDVCYSGISSKQTR